MRCLNQQGCVGVYCLRICVNLSQKKFGELCEAKENWQLMTKIDDCVFTLLFPEFYIALNNILVIWEQTVAIFTLHIPQPWDVVKAPQSIGAVR